MTKEKHCCAERGEHHHSHTKTRDRRADRVLLNIGGEVYETRERTLQRFPETLLGDRKKRQRYYNEGSQEYFFDRNRLFFDAILFYYQSYGILNCPVEISLDLFEEECRFYQISDEAIFKLKTRNLDMSYLCEVKKHVTRADHTLKGKLWNLLRYPETSAAAKFFAIFSVTMIIVSIASSCAETVFKDKPQNTSSNASSLAENKSHVLEEDPWAILDLSLNSWFLFEIVACLVSAPCKLAFFKSLMNWIDIIAVAPYFVVLAISKDKLDTLGILKIFRLLRITRLFRLSQHSTRIKVVGEVVKSSGDELKTLLIILIISVVFQASLMYFIEGYYEGTLFDSVPMAMYWSVVTQTTVGYGDIAPLTASGKLVAGVFMILGTLLLVTPVLNFADKFKSAYDSVTVRESVVAAEGNATPVTTPSHPPTTTSAAITTTRNTTTSTTTNATNPE